MTGGAERLFELRRAILADHQQAIRKTDGLAMAQAVEAPELLWLRLSPCSRR